MQTNANLKVQDSLEPVKALPQIDPFDLSFLPDLEAKGKSHFQAAFLFVPQASRRQALHDLYAYCRLLDDLSDQEGVSTEARRSALDSIRAWVLSPKPLSHSYWDRFAHQIKVMGIPVEALLGILDGVAFDIDHPHYAFETWDALNDYVYRVACCVGEATLAVLGANDARAKDYAKFMGRTLQYLNILRDLDEDEAMGRTYVPAEFLSTHPSRQEIRAELFRRATGFRALARPYSWRCLPAELMGAIYMEGAKKYWLRGIPQRLSRFEKMRAIWKALL